MSSPRIFRDLPADTAQQWIDEARDQWRVDALNWPAVTDFDRLQAAFSELDRRGVVVLQGCADHWAAKSRLEQGGYRGIAWLTAADVWHAIDEPMREVNLWHPSTANAPPGDPLLDEVLRVLSDGGLAARFDEDHIDLAARWQRRPATVGGQRSRSIVRAGHPSPPNVIFFPTMGSML